MDFLAHTLLNMELSGDNIEFTFCSKPGLLKQFIADLHSGKLHREFHHGPDPTTKSGGQVRLIMHLLEWRMLFLFVTRYICCDKITFESIMMYFDDVLLVLLVFVLVVT